MDIKTDGTHKHTPKCHCDNFVSLTESRLDKTRTDNRPFFYIVFQFLSTRFFPNVVKQQILWSSFNVFEKLNWLNNLNQPTEENTSNDEIDHSRKFSILQNIFAFFHIVSSNLCRSPFKLSAVNFVSRIKPAIHTAPGKSRRSRQVGGNNFKMQKTDR